MNDERFVKVKEHPKYSVGNYGTILSYARSEKPKKLKPRVSNSGYKYIDFGRDGGREYVHRIVAINFIVNPRNKRCVNHKDGDKLNNKASNLEWVTYSENHKHAYAKLGRNCYWKNKFGALHTNSRLLVMSNKEGKRLMTFYGANEAQRETGMKAQSIRASIRSGRGVYCGYKWEYEL